MSAFFPIELDAEFIGVESLQKCCFHRAIKKLHCIVATDFSLRDPVVVYSLRQKIVLNRVGPAAPILGFTVVWIE